MPTTPSHRRESGMAMITVLLALTVMMALAVAALDYGLGSQTASKRDASWQSALNAADAGIDNYIFHLNQDSGYNLYSASNPPPDGNLAFNQYVAIPGGGTQGSYRYSVDTSNLGVDGTIVVTSTGKVVDRKRTVQATLRRRSFLDYLYFTDYETQDPASYTGSPYSANQAQVYCSKHYYDGRNSNCSDIQFISADTINGPLHSNDAILMCGTPTFNGNTSTSWNTSGKRWRDNCPTSHPNFANPGDPAYLPPLSLPPSNSAIQNETTPANGGCLYTGPTRIKLLSSGQMTVKSPLSLETNNSCPTNGTGNLPSNGVIYVQNVPSVKSDPNYTKRCSFNVNGEKHPLGLPIANDTTSYGCFDGDVFIEGTLKGRLTVAADNNIDVTWNLTYQGGSGGTDLLGLIANNYIEVWHPVRCSSGYTSSSCNLDANFPGESARNNPFTNPTIQAAMLAVNHSVRNQNWDVGGPTGTFSVTGVIGQRYRGPVGTGSGGSIATGLAKNYQYDQRLKYQSPPKFLDPIASAWEIAVWKEIGVPAGL